MADFTREIGVSFAPTREASALAPRRAQMEGLPEAIQILSLRVPQVLGGRPIAASELLTASGGEDVGAVVESVLRSVMGGQAMAGPTVGAAGGPGAPDTSAMLAQAVQAMSRAGAIPRITPGFRPGFGEEGFLRQRPGETAFEAIQRHTRPETRQAQLSGPILRMLGAQEELTQTAPEGLRRFREPGSLAGIEELAKVTPGFLGPLSTPAPRRTFADVLRETALELQQMLAEERRAMPAVRGRPQAF